MLSMGRNGESTKEMIGGHSEILFSVLPECSLLAVEGHVLPPKGRICHVDAGEDRQEMRLKSQDLERPVRR